MREGHRCGESLCCFWPRGYCHGARKLWREEADRPDRGASGPGTDEAEHDAGTAAHAEGPRWGIAQCGKWTE